MEKKKKILYEVLWNYIDECDEGGYPICSGPFDSVEIDGTVYTGEFYTTNIIEAGKRYELFSEIVDGAENEEVILSKLEVYLGDDEWEEFVKKEILSDQDIVKTKILSTEIIARNIHTKITWDSQGGYYGEVLKVISQYFNMKAVCEKAGIKYSTYKGFKNNNQYFSTEKILSLLKCMNDIGDGCWNDQMQDMMDILKK